MSSNQEKCSVEGCNDAVFIRKHGLCITHYNSFSQKVREGTPIICQWCKEPFTVAKGYECLTKYCSDKCSGAAHRRKAQELETPGLRQERITYKYAWRLKQRGATPEYVEKKFSEQKGRCAICGVPENEVKGGFLCLDHNHETNKPRGLLCRPCNASIGGLGDSIDRVRSALAYLEKYSGKNPDSLPATLDRLADKYSMEYDKESKSTHYPRYL